MPIKVHSLSAWHGLQSWFDTGTHTNATWPGSIAPSTPKQPQPLGHDPQSWLHTPPVPAAMHRWLEHWFVSVHGSPKPLSFASIIASGASTTLASAALP